MTFKVPERTRNIASSGRQLTDSSLGTLTQPWFTEWIWFKSLSANASAIRWPIMAIVSSKLSSRVLKALSWVDAPDSCCWRAWTDDSTADYQANFLIRHWARSPIKATSRCHHRPPLILIAILISGGGLAWVNDSMWTVNEKRRWVSLVLHCVQNARICYHVIRVTSRTFVCQSC